ncbi:MAG: glycoside hydrolase [Acidobacteriia bacterium]|nr:glycoside hydrolase [Terriglobia bacterium]
MLFFAALLALHLAPVSPTAPNRQPQLAAGNGVVAVVFGSGESIWFTRSTDNGGSFSAPSKVADLPKLLLGRHRGPRVVISGGAIVVSAIATESDLFYWRSTDGGRTWSKPAVINDQAKAAREGLHAMAADAEGNVAAAWLDDRTPGGKRLYGAFSNDAGATWSKNVMLYESPGRTICECCHPSLVSLGHGEFAVMWRNVIDGSRDFYALRLRDGKPVSPAVKQGTGTWKLNACPMDGGGLAVRNGELVSAWRREHDLYIAEAGKPEVRIGTGQDVALAVNGKGAYAVWSTTGGIEARLPGSAAPTHLSDAGAFPSILALPDGSILAAWEETGSIATRRLD